MNKTYTISNVLFILTLAVVLTINIRAAVPGPPNIGITWQLTSYPNPQTIFKVYSTTNLSQNISNWPVVATFSNWVSFTNGSTITLSNNLSSPVAASFFTMTSSNFFGETSFFAPQAVYPASQISSLGLTFLGP